MLGDVGAVEAHRVGAVLTFDGVAAVAGIPDEGVVAGAEQGQVVAAVAVDQVVAVTAEQRLDARSLRASVSLPSPPSRVSAIACRGEGGGGDGVVAAEAVDGELVGRLLVLNRTSARSPDTATAEASPLT